jgi:uncharacterized protein with HEPN domain
MTPTDGTRFLLTRMRQAAADANHLIKGVQREDFLNNIMLNRAVGMSLLIASERRPN